MDKLNSMKTFVEVVDNEVFTAAAAKIGLSRAQVSKSVMALEAHLGTRLLNRTTRQVSLTDIGRLYYERSKAILDEIDEIEDLAGQQSSRARGTLTIAAPTSFGVLHLNNAIAGYLKQYTEMRISLSLNDRFVDVVSEGFDLAIRIAELEDSSLIARRIAPCKRVLVASPDYLHNNGAPKVPQDLAGHRCLVYSNDLRPGSWTVSSDAGTESVRVNGPVCADNGDVLKDAAVAGLGVALLPTFIVGPELRAGRLLQVLEPYRPGDLSVYAVFPSRRYVPARVRTFVDYLADCFGDKPDWDRY